MGTSGGVACSVDSDKEFSKKDKLLHETLNLQERMSRVFVIGIIV